MALATQCLFNDMLDNILRSISWRELAIPPARPTVHLRSPDGKSQEFSTNSAPIRFAQLLKNFGVQRESSLRKCPCLSIKYLLREKKFLP
jgi:hypothetical protein